MGSYFSFRYDVQIGFGANISMSTGGKTAEE
jgi:hypothetical protein